HRPRRGSETFHPKEIAPGFVHVKRFDARSPSRLRRDKIDRRYNGARPIRLCRGYGVPSRAAAIDKTTVEAAFTRNEFGIHHVSRGPDPGDWFQWFHWRESHQNTSRLRL